MSKITREQIRKLMLRGKTSIDNDATDIMTLIDQREAELQGQHQGLVDAATAYKEWVETVARAGISPAGLAVIAQVEPLIPPPDPHKQLADKMKGYANECALKGWGEVGSTVLQYSAEIEKLGESDATQSM